MPVFLWICCEDNPLYTLVNRIGKTQTCEWIGSRPNDDELYYWCNFEWEETGLRVTDVCPVSCKSCPVFVNVFKVVAAAETAPTSDNIKKNVFPFYYVFGAIGGAATTIVAGLVILIFRFRRRYRSNEDDDLTSSQFVMTPSEWFA